MFQDLAKYMKIKAALGDDESVLKFLHARDAFGTEAGAEAKAEAKDRAPLVSREHAAAKEMVEKPDLGFTASLFFRCTVAASVLTFMLTRTVLERRSLPLRDLRASTRSTWLPTPGLMAIRTSSWVPLPSACPNTDRVG